MGTSSNRPEHEQPGRREEEMLHEDPARLRDAGAPRDPSVEAGIRERQSARLRHEFSIWWQTLSDDEILDLASRRDELLGVLNERYGYARPEAEEVIDEALAALAQKQAQREEGEGRHRP